MLGVRAPASRLRVGRFATFATASAAHTPLVVFGSNTDVGKTLCAAGLVRAGLRLCDARADDSRVNYVKALQTGVRSIDDPAADAAAIVRHLSWFGSPSANNLDRSTLFQWVEPVSPHLAARKALDRVTDAQVRDATAKAFSKSSRNNCSLLFGIVETSGGVLSPGADFAPQADVFRPLNYSCFLVGDGKLGGINSTLTSLESLLARDYHVSGVSILMDKDEQLRLGNVDYVRKWMDANIPDGEKVPLLVLPGVPPPNQPLADWLSQSDDIFDVFVEDYVKSQETTD